MVRGRKASRGHQGNWSRNPLTGKHLVQPKEAPEAVPLPKGARRRNPLTGKHLVQPITARPRWKSSGVSQSPYGEASRATVDTHTLWNRLRESGRSQSPYGEASRATDEGSAGKATERAWVAIPLRGSISCNQTSACTTLRQGDYCRNPLTGKHLVQLSWIGALALCAST